MLNPNTLSSQIYTQSLCFKANTQPKKVLKRRVFLPFAQMRKINRFLLLRLLPMVTCLQICSNSNIQSNRTQYGANQDRSTCTYSNQSQTGHLVLAVGLQIIKIAMYVYVLFRTNLFVSNPLKQFPQLSVSHVSQFPLNSRYSSKASVERLSLSSLKTSAKNTILQTGLYFSLETLKQQLSRFHKFYIIKIQFSLNVY